MTTNASDSSGDPRPDSVGSIGDREIEGHVAALGLDAQLRIRWMTRAMRTQFDMHTSATGQPFSSVSHHFARPQLHADAQAVLCTAQPKVQSFARGDTRWLVEISPCYAGDDAIDGVALSFMEDPAFRRAREAVATIDHERRRLGQELHEVVASQLAGTAMVMQALVSTMDAAPRDLADEVRRVEGYVHEASEQASTLSHLLMPTEIEGDGLEASLRALAKRAARVWPHLSFAFDGEGKNPLSKLALLRGDVASHLYRIAVEAVWSAAKREKVSRIQIRLAAHEDHVRLTVQDDHGAVPIDAIPAGRRMLQGITWHATLIGASIDVNTTDEAGMQVVCHVPLDQAADGRTS